mmetsp:Transcript_24100/g.35719  ORF Transcript_24100/g.35719 Transcript_24100/m.35719 type:complete len:225 (-) Transcript_24100:254-928(-)
MGNTCDSKPVPSAKPVLVYWALHGRSDFCQAMLYAGGVPFELDETTANAWPASKADTPFGQVPVLKHGEMTIGQGGAINRYCARIAGLYPTDVQEAAVCDMFIEEVMDIFGAIFKAKNAPDADAKTAAWKMLEGEHLPTHFKLLEKNLEKSGKPFLGGDKANAADVAFFAVHNLYTKTGIDVEGAIADCPKLKAALEGTLKVGDLKSFPNRGLYFTSDPSHDSF